MKRLAVAIVLAAALAGTARGQASELTFVDWTSGADGHAEGTLLGRPVTIAGVTVSHFTETDDKSDFFKDPAVFTPALALTDYVYFSGTASAPGVTLTFGAPVQDPTFHFFSLASTIAFDSGQATLVSSDGHLHVSGGTVTPDRVGGPDSNGTVRLSGTFTRLTFTASYTVSSEDGIYMQVGASPVPVQVTPTPSASPQPTTPPAKQLLPPDQPPVTGVRVSTRPATGTVTVKLPDSDTYLPLASAASLPVGSVVDARRGTVSFQAAGASSTQSATISAGIFAIRQARARGAVAAFVLQTPPGQARACATGPKKGAVRALTVAAKGVFRTVAAKGIVKGANATWTVSDRCNGTLTKVKRGRVAVASRHRTTRLRAGQSLLIRARLFGAKRSGR